MTIEEIAQDYDLTYNHIEAVKNLNAEQRLYVQGYADALENSSVR